MGFPSCFAWFKNEFRRVNDLRQRPEKLWACALQIAKQADYSPKPSPLSHQIGGYSNSVQSAPKPQTSELKVPTCLKTDRPHTINPGQINRRQIQ
jgi:hypothetical protein